MTTIAMRFDGFLTPHTDRGIGNDAVVLQGRFLDFRREISHSESLGKSYRDARNALLEAYWECGTNNWDGYGAAAVSLGDLCTAMKFISILPTSIPTPEVSVDPDGEFSFDWHNKDCDVLSLSIGLHGRISYAARFGESRTHGTEYFADELPPAVIANLERLFC